MYYIFIKTRWSAAPRARVLGKEKKKRRQNICWRVAREHNYNFVCFFVVVGIQRCYTAAVSL